MRRALRSAAIGSCGDEPLPRRATTGKLGRFNHGKPGPARKGESNTQITGTDVIDRQAN
jgi:hypothetical protein